MKKKSIVITVFIVLVLAFAAVAVLFLLNRGYRSVKVQDIQGDVVVKRESEKLDAFEDMQLKSEDKVTVEDESELVMQVDTDKTIVARENTTFKLTATGNEKKGNVTLDVLDGNTLISIENKLNEDSSFNVNTSNASLSVRGTEFEVSYDEDTSTSFVYVTKGKVAAKYEGGKVTLEAGDSLLANDEGMVVDDVYRLTRTITLVSLEGSYKQEVNTSGDLIFKVIKSTDDDNVLDFGTTIYDWTKGEDVYDIQISFRIGISDSDLEYETKDGHKYGITCIDWGDEKYGTLIILVDGETREDGDGMITVHSLSTYASEEEAVEDLGRIAEMLFE